jgi:glycosyltransferase involved in cell wall biosynthesis
MRILYFSNSYIPSKNANSVHVMKMCFAFSKFSSVTLYGSYGSEAVNPFTYYGLTNKFNIVRYHKTKTFTSSLVYLIATIKSVKVSKDLLVYGRNLLAVLLLSFKRIEVVYESHALPSNLLRVALENFLFRQKSFKKLVVISSALKQDYLAKFPKIHTSMIIVAHDGADIPAVMLEEPAKKLIEEFQDVKLHVGYIGHLYKGRGIDMVIKLAYLYTDAFFHIIGGTDEDLNYWQELPNLPTNVKFYGHVDHYKLPNYFNFLEVLLAPYQLGANQSDGLSNTNRWMSPMKIFEYMSYAKPIISSDIPVLKEVLNDSNSILVSPSNVDEWISALDSLKCKKKRKDLGAKAFKDLKEKYTWEQRAKTILENL